MSYKIDEIEGIGSAYAATLSAAGLRGGRGLLRILDVHGCLLLELDVPIADESAVWDGCDASGARVSAGVYLIEWSGAGRLPAHERVVKLRS